MTSQTATSNGTASCSVSLPQAVPNKTADEAVRDFFDHLAEAFPKDPQGRPPDHFRAFREQCEQRERAGREVFRDPVTGRPDYVDRDNALEGCEEAADIGVYALLAVEAARLRGEDPNTDLALMAAFHAAHAHHFLLRLREKRRGSP